MRIFNEEKTKELLRTDIDLSKGHLRDDKITIHHDEIPAVEAVEEQGHYEVIAEYPNGGKDVEWVVDVERVEPREAVPAYDETEDIQVYVLYTQRDLYIQSLYSEMESCLEWLNAHDYIGIKIATGRATAEEYAEEIAQMSVVAKRVDEIKKTIKETETE